MKSKYIFFLFLLLPIQLFSQETADSFGQWMVEVVSSEKDIQYSVGGIFTNTDERILTYENGWIELVQNQSFGQEITVFHVSDIDPASVRVVDRDDIDSSKMIYQLIANTKDRLDLISIDGGFEVDNRFSLYFLNSESASEFAYALQRAASLSPDKLERSINVMPGDDFRNIDWGMTKQQVIALEDGEIIKSVISTTLNYQISIQGIIVEISYWFRDGGLYLAICDFPDVTFDDYNEYISFFNDVKAYFTQLYGHPAKTEEIWENERFKNQPEKYGFALSQEHFHRRISWENEPTEIMLTLSGHNGVPIVNCAFTKISD